MLVEIGLELIEVGGRSWQAHGANARSIDQRIRADALLFCIDVGLEHSTEQLLGTSKPADHTGFLGVGEDRSVAGRLSAGTRETW